MFRKNNDLIWRFLDVFKYIFLGASLIYILSIEEFTFFHLAIIGLLCFSIFKSIKGQNEYISFLTMFLVFDAYLNLILSSSVISNYSSLFIAILVFFFVLQLNKTYIQTKELKAKDFWAFSWLLVLVILELFFSLSFFPVNTTNKAILLTIFFWFYIEAMHARIETRFSKTFMLYLTLVFLIIFSILVFSIPFEQRF